MALPWVRLDSNIATHDKIVALVDEKDGYRSAFSYVCSLGYAAGHETDGLVQFGALGFVHGTKKTAEMLVKHYLWSPTPLGWQIVNYGKRQQLSATTALIKNARSAGAKKANCTRWHGAACRCWEATG